jgi:hypothetical protein
MLGDILDSDLKKETRGMSLENSEVLLQVQWNCMADTSLNIGRDLGGCQHITTFTKALY